jgi:hypothetical protein
MRMIFTLCPIHSGGRETLPLLAHALPRFSIISRPKISILACFPLAK